MNADVNAPFLRVPVGQEAPRWATFQGQRTLVVAVRTVTSALRVLETLPALLRDDPRVTVVFAHDPTTAFGDGVAELLREAGCRTMPWAQLASAAPDLIVSASENVDLPAGGCPVLVLPHGVGFQKWVPDARGSGTRLSGLVPDSLLEAGRAWLAISHPEQQRQLLAAHPGAAGRTLLTGDPCYDQLRASLPRAAAYRRALGVGDGRRLVVVSSTWGRTSLLGQWPELPARLLAALPADEYRVAAIVHPNVWAAHGSWQLRNLQAAALDAGLLLVPPAHAWRPALVAADAVVGDHGSVSLYAAALGKPVLLGAFGEEAVAGTAADLLGRLAPRLRPGDALRARLERAVAESPADRQAEVAGLAFAEPGRALERLRTALYRLLRLPEPDAAPAPTVALPHPDPPAAAPTAWTVVTEARGGTARGGRPAEVTVRRYPAAVCGDEGPEADEAPGPDGDASAAGASFVHLACEAEEPDQRLVESASVLARQRPATAVAAREWTRDALERLPGCLLAVTALASGGFLARLRDGRVVEATAAGAAVDAGLAAALVYTCLRAGLPLDDALVTLRIGRARESDVALRLRPA